MSETETKGIDDSMSDTGKDYLPQLLNRVEALIDSGAGSLTELAAFLLPDQNAKQARSRVAEWIRSRQRNPNGETALRMQTWAAKKTLEITGNRKASTAYRKAFEAIEAKGKRETAEATG